jgi:hypothetical protein
MGVEPTIFPSTLLLQEEVPFELELVTMSIPIYARMIFIPFLIKKKSTSDTKLANQ